MKNGKLKLRQLIDCDNDYKNLENGIKKKKYILILNKEN